jgi:transposase
MVLVDGNGTPLGVHVDSASPAEVKLLKTTMASVSVGGKRGRPRSKPERLVLDRAYDSNPERKRLDALGVEPIIPARKNNKKATHQDGRKLRRYRRRWIVERTNAWLQNFRRLVVRYERSAEIYEGLVHLACALITLRKVLK